MPGVPKCSRMRCQALGRSRKRRDVADVELRGAAPTEMIDGIRVRRIGRLRSGTFHLRVQRELARVRDIDVIIDEINSVPFLTPLWRHRLPPVVALIHQLAEDVWDAELPRPLARSAARWSRGCSVSTRTRRL